MIFESIALTLFGWFLLSSRDCRCGSSGCCRSRSSSSSPCRSGFGWILAATYVFFRDLMPILGFVLSIVFYLSPILYPVGRPLRASSSWNPMTPLLGLFRSAMLSAALPAASSIVFLMAVTFGALAGGLTLFRRAQPTLVDLI